MQVKKWLPSLVVAALAGMVGGMAYQALWPPVTPTLSLANQPTAQPINYPLPTSPSGDLADFNLAAEAGSASVVFIKTLSASRNTDEYWSTWDFFGDRGPISSAGSGVIISPDGYVVTNNHVVEKAEKIEVSLRDKHSYPAKVVGTDPSTDLALLKIEATNLKPLTLANSDKVRIGDWVLAVGNPFNLTYTVTAGIISAKGRNINVVNSQFPIESYLQTDAAINPGNSGGALLNLAGQLIGINSAIATRTGAYNGYGFAIPANIVKKVVRDLTEFGEVQRAFIGAEVVDIDERMGSKLGLTDYSGVAIESVAEEGAAHQAGLRVGDVVLKLNEQEIESKAEFLEHLSYYRPGEKLHLTLRRSGQALDAQLTLTNRENTTAMLKRERFTSNSLGADFSPLSKVEKQKYKIENGYRITAVRAGRLASMGLQEGFIIVAINRYSPESVGELIRMLENMHGRIMIEGLQPNGSRGYYSFFSY